jgi:hypothetical protein
MPLTTRSFELYRRPLYGPDIVMFMNVLARVEGHISAGGGSDAAGVSSRWVG